MDRIWGVWGSYYSIPKAVFYLLKGHYTPAARSAGSTLLHVGDSVFYCGSWAGDQASQAVQYYGRSARVLRVLNHGELKLQFSDGKIRCTKNWSRQEPTLPGKFRRQQRVYYVGKSCFKHDRDSCLFGHRLKILGRAASNGEELIALQLESGDRHLARHTSLSTKEPRHSSGFFLHQKVQWAGGSLDIRTLKQSRKHKDHKSQGSLLIM